MHILCEHMTLLWGISFKLKTTEWKVQANETRCLLDREPCRLFILRGPKCLTQCVDLSSHQYPKNWLLADFVWGFHPKITIWRNQRNPFIYVRSPEGPRIKHCLVVRWDSMSSKRPMHVILCEVFLLKRNPKRGRKSAFIYVERAQAEHNMI